MNEEELKRNAVRSKKCLQVLTSYALFSILIKPVSTIWEYPTSSFYGMRRNSLLSSLINMSCPFETPYPHTRTKKREGEETSDNYVSHKWNLGDWKRSFFPFKLLSAVIKSGGHLGVGDFFPLSDHDQEVHTCLFDVSLQVLTEYVVQDLNDNPKLPFGDNTFDVITNVVCTSFSHSYLAIEWMLIFSASYVDRLTHAYWCCSLYFKVMFLHH